MTRDDPRGETSETEFDFQTQSFRLDDVVVRPLENLLEVDGETKPVEPKAMQVLAFLSARAGQIVATKALIAGVWGQHYQGENPTYRIVSLLRESLGDDKNNPRFVQTVAGKGYRLVATPVPHQESSGASATGRKPIWPWLGLAAVLIAAFALWSWRVDQGPPSPGAGDYTLAVLAFKDNGEGGSITPLSEGIAEELLILLGRIDEFELASRHASFYFSDPDRDVNEIGTILNVDYVLDGSVQRKGDRLYVRAHLSETGNNERQKWANRFEYDVDDIVKVQADIATQVTAALEVVLADQALLGTVPTADAKAFDAYLRARGLLRGPRDEPLLLEAVDLFSEALERDPDFVRAAAGMCQAYVALYSTTRTSNYSSQAQKSCQSLVAANPALPEVRIALGALYRERGDLEQSRRTLQAVVDAFGQNISALIELGDTLSAMRVYAKAERAYRRAVDMAPNDYDAQSALAVFLFRQRDFRGAAEHFRRVTYLKPRDPRALNNLASANYMLDDIEQAAATWDKSIAIEPRGITLTNRGLVSYYLSRFEEAVGFQRRALEQTPEDHRLWGRLAEALRFVPGQEDAARSAYEMAERFARERLAQNATDAVAHAGLANYRAHLGKSLDVTSAFARAHELSPNDRGLYQVEALTWAEIGEIDEVLRCLRRAIELGFSRRLIHDDPEFQALGDDPRMSQFLSTLRR